MATFLCCNNQSSLKSQHQNRKEALEQIKSKLWIIQNQKKYDVIKFQNDDVIITHHGGSTDTRKRTRFGMRLLKQILDLRSDLMFFIHIRQVQIYE